MKEAEVFDTGTKKLVISLREDRPGDWCVRMADDLGNFTTFPVDSEFDGQRSARLVADVIARMVRKAPKKRSPRQKARWWYVVKREHLEGHQVYAVMDMLRYDGARVECTGPVGFWTLSKDADDGAPLPNEERWRSYHMKVYVIAKSPYQPTQEEIQKVVAEEDRLVETKKAQA